MILNVVMRLFDIEGERARVVRCVEWRGVRLWEQYSMESCRSRRGFLLLRLPELHHPTDTLSFADLLLSFTFWSRCTIFDRELASLTMGATDQAGETSHAGPLPSNGG